MRSGQISIYYGSLRYSGTNGFFWTPVAVLQSNSDSIELSARYPSFSNTGVGSSSGPGGRQNGFPLRCTQNNKLPSKMKVYFHF